MGLGPPVCEKCHVYGTIDERFVERNVSRWYCPVCGNEQLKWSAWDCGLTDEELKCNLKFYDFIKGKKDGEVSEETSSN